MGVLNRKFSGFSKNLSIIRKIREKNKAREKKNVSPQKKGYNEKQEHEVVGNYARKRAIFFDFP